MEYPDWLEAFQAHKHGGGGGLNLVSYARFDYSDGQWTPYLHHDVTYPQLKTLLKRQCFSLPTADEWAYLCGSAGPLLGFPLPTGGRRYRRPIC